MYPIIDQGQESIAGWTDNRDAVVFEGLPLVVFGDHTRASKYVDFPFAAGADGTKLLRPDTKRFDPIFFYFALTNLQIPSKGYNRHFRYLKEMVFRYPELKDEQRVIAHVLQTVQKTKEARQRELALEREHKAALMEHLLTHGTRGEATKQSEIGGDSRKLGGKATQSDCRFVQRGNAFEITTGMVEGVDSLA